MILMFHVTEREPTFNTAHVISLQNFNILFKQSTTAQVKSIVRIKHIICSATLFRRTCEQVGRLGGAEPHPHGRSPLLSPVIPAPRSSLPNPPHWTYGPSRQEQAKSAFLALTSVGEV